MKFTNGKQELQETLEEWNGLFTRNRLKINLGKTEVLHIGHQKEELDIELEGKTLTQGDSFRYLRGAVCRDGKMEREVHRRAQAGAKAWRTVEGGDGGPADLKKTKGQQWEGHVERMADDRLLKRAAELCEQGKRRRRRPRRRWEDCVKRDVRKAGQ